VNNQPTYRQFDAVSPEFVRLTDELDQELWAKQGEAQAAYHGFNRLEGIHDVVIAYEGEEPMGCASFKNLEPGVAEVKRVFVRPTHRGRGISRGLMAALEARAASQGVGVLLVETSRNFAEAVGLYRSLGYAEVENYPPYVGMPESVCFRKELGRADPPETFQPLNLAAWHRWLRANHRTSKGVWFVSFKKATGKPRVEYEEAVEEALCWGWIDSVTRSLDERTMFRFTPRKKGSVWARSNKARLVKLEAQERMQPSGWAVVEEAKADGSWSRFDEAEEGIVPGDLGAELARYPDAARHFEAFPPGERRRILGWIAQAKTAPTRARRIAQAAGHAQKNERIDDWKNSGKATGETE